MERVQFQQEQMLAELKDLVDKNIFTLKETKFIVKKRTAFEAALVRRIAKKSDFLRYAAYEMGLEQLRRKRVERLKIPRTPTTISDYALVRRQFHIFERALKRFRADVGLWIQYVEVAKREGARTLVGRITARALQLHPNTPALYILAASHELDHLSPSSARALLQRGIRLNPESADIWTEYVRMELGFVESLRRRWGVLGIDENIHERTEAAAKDEALMIEESGHSHDAIPIQEDDSGLDVGAVARKEIMAGAIVKSVMSNAVQALPRIELFEALNELIIHYPIPTDLRDTLLLHLDELLQTTIPNDPRSVKLLCTRCLRPDMHGAELVEGIKKANETLIGATDRHNEQVLAVYANFVEEWSCAVIDDNLKLYLIASLEQLIQRERASPSLLCAHIRILGQRGDGETALQKARRYTSRVASSATMWLVRLDMERRYGNEASAVQAWAEARRSVAGSNEEVLPVWQWGLHGDIEATDEQLDAHETLLKESMAAGLLAIHEELLINFVQRLYKDRRGPKTGLDSDQRTKRSEWDRVRHMDDAYLATGNVWREVFRLEEQAEVGGEATLRTTFESWRRKDKDGASLEWAAWLLRHGKGKEASELISGAGLGEHWNELVRTATGDV